MKKLFLAPVLLFLVLVVPALVWWNGARGAPSANSEERRVVITRGASASQVASTLKEAGVVKNALAFRVYTRITGKAKTLPTGEFIIPMNLSLAGVIDKILEGPAQLWVTVPEGLRREQIPGRFIDALELQTEKAQNFRLEFLAESQGLEGFLFPDTYLIPRDVTGTQAVSLMRNTFDKRFSLQGGEFELAEVVALASIIEREAITDEERPVVAGVFMNRLAAGMPLQADATVQYAVANARCGVSDIQCNWWPKGLTREDLQTRSAFNTYQNAGIPPAPIANPGLSSLEAAAGPADTDFFYYIHDSSGQIHFAETLSEHNANVAKYLGKF